MAEDKKLNPEELENVAGGSDGWVLYEDPTGKPIGKMRTCPKCKNYKVIYVDNKYHCDKCGYEFE